MTTGFKASLIGNGCTSPDGTMVHAPTDKIVTLAEYFAKSETGRLRDALFGLLECHPGEGEPGSPVFVARQALTS